MRLRQLFEYKQVGTIYHFTDLHSAWSILENQIVKIGDENGAFTASGSGFTMTQPRTAISFTRNPRMTYPPRAGGGNIPWNSVRIAFDGDKLSHRYKIEPYNDEDHGIIRQDGQAEERVVGREVNIKGTVLAVDFNYQEFMRRSTDWESWVSVPDEKERIRYTNQSREEAAFFIRFCRKQSYPLRIVTRF